MDKVNTVPAHGLLSMQLETKMDMDFSQPIYIDGAASTIVQTDGTYLEVLLHDEIPHLPHEMDLDM